MNLGLGIDTGGTYTDAVIYDFDGSRPLAWAKALTTKRELTIGIVEALNKLPKAPFKDIRLVSLSTTLATNACVENKGGRAALILMGYDEAILRRYGYKYGLSSLNEMILIPGRHGQHGERLEPPSWEYLHRAIEQRKGKVDTFGIAEYWGIRNPEYEQQAKEYIAQWTGLPAVCAHELSGEINSLRRAASTLLNARLIPLITELIKAVKQSLKALSIEAPLMIVRGDGTLMTEEFAMQKPVETLLSGPAASVSGGMKLSGVQDCVIVDMGGTTSDVAVVRQGRVVVTPDGVNVGGWRTGTAAIQIDTIGLGGDSLVSFDANAKLTVGPRKAAPLSWLASLWPQAKDELKRIHAAKKSLRLSMAEFFYSIRPLGDDADLTAEEKNVLACLKEGPLSIEQLSTMLNCRPFMLPIKRLEDQGIIARSGLTPTDMMHITGRYAPWDVEAATLGAEIMAQQLGLTVVQLSDAIRQTIVKSLYDLIMRILLERQLGKRIADMPRLAQQLIDMGFDGSGEDIKCTFTAGMPLVGIGAPIHLYLPETARRLGTSCIIPDHAPVANAIGAITGSIMVEQSVLVRPIYCTSGIVGYSCHSSENHVEIKDYQQAVEWAKGEALNLAKLEAQARGAHNMEILLEQKIKEAPTKDDQGSSLLLDVEIVACGIGKAM